MARTFFTDMNYAFQQGGDLTKEIVTHQHKLLDQQAQLKARTQMLEYKVAENEFLKSLESDGDYENWQKKADNFLTSQKEYINQNAGNALTAKYMNQNLDASRANLQIQVGNKVFERMRKDELNEYNRQMQLVNENTSGQDRINGIEDLLKEMKDKNFVDEASYDKYVTQAYSSATLDEFNKVSDGISSQAVANGWTEDKTEAEIKKAIEALPAFTMKSKSGEDISQLFTPQMKAEAVAAAVKRGNDVYKDNLKVLQTKNKEYCAELLRRERSLAPDDYKGRNYLRSLGRTYLKQQEELNSNAFSAEGKQEYASAFQPLKAPKDKNGQASLANAKKKFEVDVDSLANMWVQHKFTGDYEGINTGEEAIDFLDVKARAYARANELDEDSFAIDMRYKLIDALENKIKLVPEAAEAVANVKNTLKLNSNTSYDFEAAWEIAGPMLMSEIFTLDIGSAEGKKALKYKATDICTQITLHKLTRNAEGSKLSTKARSNSKYFSDGGDSQTYPQKKAYMTDAFADLNGSATYAYKNIRTGEHMIKPGAEDMIETLKADTQETIGGILGVDPTKITTTWHKDSNHHITDQIDFRLEDGRVLSAISRNGELSFVDNNGKEVISSAQVNNYFANKDNEKRAQSYAAENQKKENKKKLKEAQAALDAKNAENYDKHKKASEIQALINKHEDEIQRHVKEDGWRQVRAIKEVINKYNETAQDKIEYFDDWKSYLPM